MQWPPNYTEVFKQRANRIKQIRDDPSLAIGAKAYYKDNPADFINDWGVTYDPRNAGSDKPTLMPFVLFPRQRDLVEFVHFCLNTGRSGLVEKVRDAGVTWACGWISIWGYLFHEGTSIGWGSRKESLVDKLGDPDSIFEKIRMGLKYLPEFFLPKGFNEQYHSHYMRLINPENSATITGESGDSIGRGGRKTIYFKDECAHYDHADKIEASLSENTDVQIDISSVNGPNNPFYNRRMAGEIWEPDVEYTSDRTPIFIFDWRDHPAKTQEWHDKKKRKAEEEGMLHIFSQEVERDYNASTENIVIPNEWVQASIDAHKKLGFEDDFEGLVISALDVADEGGDKNAYSARKGPYLFAVKSWGQGDTGETALKAVSMCTLNGASSMQYDCIGVGAGVKAETNRLKRSKIIKDTLDISPWNAGAGVLMPNGRVIEGDKESPKNKDFFHNLKAQAWWMLRTRFEKTAKAIRTCGKFDPETMISISSGLKCLREITTELSQVTLKYKESGKMVINKKPDGAKSPNLADSVVMAYWPIFKRKVLI